MSLRLAPTTIDALVEVITGGGAYTSAPVIGVYRKGYALESFMRGCGVKMQLGGRSRCAAIRETLLGLVEQGNESALRTIIERSADPRDFIDKPESLQTVIEHLNRRLTLDGLELRRQGLAVQLVNASTSASVLESLASATHALDLDTVRRDLDRALASAEADPEDAVTAACSVVESVCHSILTELELPLPNAKDVQHLFKAVQAPLGLSPARTDLPDEIVMDVKLVLQGLASMVQGIGALRTHAGDAHGRERGFKRIDPRIARLAIHSASCAALFIIETWQKRPPRTAQQVA